MTAPITLNKSDLAPPIPALPDLLIAATAERHRVTLLHYDHEYDLIATVTRQPTEWVVPRGTADTR